jgi:hypothetical protein
MSMNVLTYDLVEYVLSFCDGNDIKNFGRTNKEYKQFVRNCVTFGRFFDTYVYRCVSCDCFMITPMLECLLESDDIFYLCSKNCKLDLFDGYQKNFFCLFILKFRIKIF